MRQKEPPQKGVLPPRAARVFVPPMIDPRESPILPVRMTIDAPPEMAIRTTAFGDPTGFFSVSAGTGGPAGIGNGVGDQIGGGRGSRYGQGDEDGVYSIGGGGASAPVVIRMVEPEYSEMARRARISGSVLVDAEIGPDGKPHHVRVTRGMGAGLDEKAIEAVTGWLFRPGEKNGRPVTVRATFEVNFRLL